MIEREREESKPFSGNFTGFCMSELGKPRVKVVLSDKSYAWVPKSQDFAKVQVSTKTEKRRCLEKSRKLK